MVLRKNVKDVAVDKAQDSNGAGKPFLHKIFMKLPFDPIYTSSGELSSKIQKKLQKWDFCQKMTLVGGFS
jgi:hypothetical protein